MTLIPKKSTPMNLGEYRPISLIGSLYKIIAKVLSKRLQSVIHKVISVEQSAFMKGRFILDGILVANEVVDEVKRKKDKCMIFKADFEKAFDSINHNFLSKVLERMGFGLKCRVNSNMVETMASRFGCQVGIFPFMYLGLPIGCKMKNIKDWEPYIEKFHKRLDSWKAKLMSFGGRLTLIKLVLSSLLLYAFSLFHAPSSVINKLEGLRRLFFWGGSGESKKLSWIICKGDDSLFWHDKWLDGYCLKDKFGRLYNLDRNKDALVMNRWFKDEFGNIMFSWEWSRNSRGRMAGEFQNLSNLVHGFRFTDGTRDKWSCNLFQNGSFTVLHLSKMIDEKLLGPRIGAECTDRVNIIPKKIGLLVWRAKQNRIPVRIELDKRGIDLDSVRCPVCTKKLKRWSIFSFSVTSRRIYGPECLDGGTCLVYHTQT
ncbi:uncharacterized protein [Rutidosis leptorrhynchoides]|uniref:uncharacterized protein n=1 Tax=Rutidosis leptorrhynchoides TaxID=125765 RepID=UPI003A995AC0